MQAIAPATTLKPASSSTSMAYLPGLDGMRGYAVILVIISHWLPENHLINSIAPWGLLGVTCFFILSGYLITSILMGYRRNIEVHGAFTWLHLGRFFYRRTLRIFPIYYLTLLYLYVFNVTDIRSSFKWHVFYSSDLYFFLQQTWQGAISHFWTLSVEEKFYIFWPLLLLFVRSKHHPVVIVGTLVAGLLFEIATANIPFAVFTTPACLSSFAIGAVLAYVNFNKIPLKVSAALLPASVAALVAAIVAVNLQMVSPAYLHFTLKLAASPLALLIIYQVSRGETGIVLQKVLGNVVIVYLGRISYGLYLYHNLITPVATGSLYTDLLQKTFLLLGLATLSYYCVEKPLLALKNKL